MAGGSNVQLGGLDRWRARQVTVGTSLAQLDASPLSGRNAVSIRASTANSGIVHVGNSSAMSTAAGSTNGTYALGKGAPLDIGISTNAQVWVKATAASQRISFAEIG